MGEWQPDANEQPTRRRVTVQEAAELLGVTVEAVRGRIKRGKLEAERDKDGSVYVWLAADQPTTGHDQPTTGPQPDTDRPADQTALVESLLEQVRYMREQLAEEREARRRADTIMAQLSQANAEQARTIRALEAPRDEPQAPQSASEEPAGTDKPPERENQSSRPGGKVYGTSREEAEESLHNRPWWRRWFGG